MNWPARRNTILLAAILLFGAAFRLAMLNGQFLRDSEGCGAFFGLLARNYFRYGIFATRGLPVMSMGAGADQVYYANHPPTVALLITFVYAVTGYRGGYDQLPSEWQTRLPSACFTVACIWLIYRLVNRRAGPRAGLLAAALFASIPMTLVFGGLPDVINPQLDFFVLLTIATYERFHDRTNWRSFGLFVAAFTGAGILDWPAYFLVPVLCLHLVLTRPARELKWIVGFGAMSVALFTVLYAHATLGQLDWRWMLHQIQRRGMNNVADAGSGAFTLTQWVRHAIWELAIARHSAPVCLLALLWAAMAFARRFSGPADRLAGLLLAWAVVHVLLGRQGVFQHEWWWWPLTPGLVIAAALAADQLLSMLKERLKGISPTTLNAFTTLLVIAFTCWNVRAAILERRSAPGIVSGPLNYSLAELGQAIRDSTPADAAVMVAESDQSLASWYYADRPTMRRVWDLGTFQSRLTEKRAEISFEAYQRWDGPIAAMIIPKAYYAAVESRLIEYLDANFARREGSKFVVWDLRAQKGKPGQ